MSNCPKDLRLCKPATIRYEESFLVRSLPDGPRIAKGEQDQGQEVPWMDDERITRPGGSTSFVVIPARLHSTRLPRKLLLRETGKSLIQHTCEAAQRARKPVGLWVACDHPEIYDEVRSFGGRAVMTDPNAASGTDRVAEVAKQLGDIDIIVNVQGDEPEIAGTSIDLTIELLEGDPDAVMSTLATPIRTRHQLDDPACVKVVFDSRGRAIYFSRSPIPHPRQWDDALLTAEPASFYQHVGLYAYRREFLLGIAQLPQPAIERIECLEQLRVVDAGYPIRVGVVDEPTFGIDTPADYEAFVRKWQKGLGIGDRQA
jgi:3-deoxy-manno-octulosonate cytidylyltransferase (CMP-KDO synthetase)